MRAPFATCLLLVLAACGDSATTTAGKPAAQLLNDAETAEQAQDWKAMLACADGALADPKATGEEKQQAWLAKVSATARASGAEAAKGAITAMGASSDVPSASNLASLASDLVAADLAAVAVDVVAAADAKYGSDPAAKKRLKKVAKMCKAKLEESGDAGALAQLQALGYLSSSDDEDEVEDG